MFSKVSLPIALASIVALFSVSAQATTVLQVDVDYLLEHAELVFEGEVISHEAHWNDNKTAIYTLVTFRLQDVIKGEYNESELTLHFAGGTRDGIQTKVSAMVFPEVGEQGIYFVETLAVDQVNPLLGWGQGHLILETDDQGVQRVLTEDQQTIVGLAPKSTDASALQSTISRSQLATVPAGIRSEGDYEFSEGVAKGLDIADGDVPSSAAVDKATFKDQLRGRLLSLNASNEQDENGSGSAESE